MFFVSKGRKSRSKRAQAEAGNRNIASNEHKKNLKIDILTTSSGEKYPKKHAL
jgi:hypothetical protein